jgi:WhiB family redox-sensing transcriptional regulator
MMSRILWRNDAFTGQSLPEPMRRCGVSQERTPVSNTMDLASLIEGSNELPWLRQAACRELELSRLDLFFVEAGRTLSKEAKALCGGCTARAACLTYAYRHDITGGYFGGLSPAKRRELSLADALEVIA